MSERKAIPDFELPATGNQRFRLSAFKGHPLILYFYPKDAPPGCTDESLQLRDLHAQFAKAGWAGRIAREWRGVKVAGHAAEVLAFPRSP